MCRLQKTIYNWALFKGCIGLVLSLPMRDGNDARVPRAVVGHQVLSLPMRDGNSYGLSSFGYDVRLF